MDRKSVSKSENSLTFQKAARHKSCSVVTKSFTDELLEPSFLKKVTSEVFLAYSAVLPTEDMMQTRKETTEKLVRLAEKERYGLSMFGSAELNLQIHSSDLDFNLSTGENLSKQEILTLMDSICVKLREDCGFVLVKTVPAAVPVIKGVDPETLINLDITSLLKQNKLKRPRKHKEN